MKILLASMLTSLLVSQASAADTLEIYVVDTEGGKAVILVSPQGETMLIDAGYPTPDGRDTNRIVAAAKAAGIEGFDYIVATHYDLDHSGNVAAVDALIPGKVFIDHGEPLPTLNARNVSTNYKPYVKAIGDRKRISVQPGDRIPFKGVQITVVTAGGKAITKPLPGAGQPNPLTPDARPTYRDRDDNAGSVGMLFEFGKFRMLDLADLLSWVEYDLVCPNNLVGAMDLFMVSHHGFKVSNAKFLVDAIRPKVAVMNNGPRKGGDPEVLEMLNNSPGMQDVWQLHFSPAAGDKNARADCIANLQARCEGKLIRISAQRNGAFTVTNTRNGYSKTYQP